jgi:hypothetical protein
MRLSFSSIRFGDVIFGGFGIRLRYSSSLAIESADAKTACP